jgi:hypothetical protein
MVGRISILFFVITLGLSNVRADERVLPLATLQKMGYRPFNSFPHYRGQRQVRSELPTGLKWPVQFVDAARNIAQNYVNFQQYGGDLPYYHKGCDLRSPPNSIVKAPVTGVLEGGYYSYTDNPDGSEIKHWIPWNGKTHSDPYFELAVVTPDGYRFEMHHVDSMNLPKETIQALNKGNVVVQEGTAIGTVIPWGRDYDHIHYNIFRQDGVIVNPEAYTVSPADHIAPKIQAVYGVRADGSVIEIINGGTVGPLQQIIVATTETRDNSIYVQTPPYIGIQFQTREMFAWDFRKVLLGPDAKWPDIRQVFVARFKTPNGKVLTTSGQYGQGLFLMRLPVPAARGPFVIAVSDTAGNTTKFSGVMQ